jgi:AcrR family transcriptional regulator
MTPKIITRKKGAEGKRGRGRPAVFDRAIALQAAMKLFWERGYEGTSFDDLISTMGISASSFYNSFGSTEALYCEATRSYLEWSGQWFFAILNDPSIDTGRLARLFRRPRLVYPRRSPARLHDLAGRHALPASMSNIRDMMAEHALSEGAMAARIERAWRMATCLKHRLRNAGCPITARSRRDGASRQLAQIGRPFMSAWPVEEWTIKARRQWFLRRALISGFRDKHTTAEPGQKDLREWPLLADIVEKSLGDARKFLGR